jgi:hypothetical protein
LTQSGLFRTDLRGSIGKVLFSSRFNPATTMPCGKLPFSHRPPKLFRE